MVTSLAASVRTVLGWVPLRMFTEPPSGARCLACPRRPVISSSSAASRRVALVDFNRPSWPVKSSPRSRAAFAGCAIAAFFDADARGEESTPSWQTWASTSRPRVPRPLVSHLATRQRWRVRPGTPVRRTVPSSPYRFRDRHTRAIARAWGPSDRAPRRGTVHDVWVMVGPSREGGSMVNALGPQLNASTMRSAWSTDGCAARVLAALSAEAP